MDFERQISQMFHDEHLVATATLERFQALMHTHREGPPSDPADELEFNRTLRDFEGLFAGEILAHFKFEEDSLFPLLSEAGEGDMGPLLMEEHVTILSAADVLVTLSRKARSGDMNEEDWQELRLKGMDFVETMLGHIQKEEMGMIPTLDNVVDEIRDAELVMEYSSVR